jgi:drug/metabolite transporter (DMT)-like permease
MPLDGAHRFVSLLTNPYFIVALLVYFCMTVLWVWILSFMPLAKAYPFTILSYVLVPIVAVMFLGESIGRNYYIGGGFIMIGLIFIAK